MSPKKSLFVIFIFSILLLNSAFSQQLALKKLTENLYAVTGGGGNCAFLVTDEGVLVVDSKTSPSLGEQLLKKIREITDKEIKYLVFTHYHGDHIQGAQIFEKSTVISHSNTKRNIEKITIPRIEELKTKTLPEQIESVKERVEKLKAENSPELKKAEEDLFNLERRLKDIENLKIVQPQLTVEKSYSVKIGMKEVVLFYSGRGHTDGDLIVYFPSEKTIHMGDLLFNNIIPVIDFQGGSNTENWIKILEEVEKMDVETIIPGHGEIGDKTILRSQAEYLKALRNEVKQLIDEGLSLEDTIKKAELPAYKNMDGYNQRFPRNVEAVYREFKENK